jgi:catechol 2,3-dioxygenase-like lactoylglutathione lyase family enzyme
MALDILKLRALQPPAGLGFKIRRLGHVVLQVTDLNRSLLFYTQVLGFKVTEIYSEDLQPGGFAFLRCHTDHHTIALVGTGAGQSRHAELHHIAFEIGSVEEVFAVRERLREQGATITFEGRRRAGCQIAVEFLDPDGHCLEIYWGIGPDRHQRLCPACKRMEGDYDAGSRRRQPGGGPGDPHPKKTYSMKGVFERSWNKKKTGARWA